MFIQFDGEITDLGAFIQGMDLVGLYPPSVRASRWFRIDELTLAETDAGGRIDIEIVRETYPAVLIKIQAIQDYVAASPYVSHPLSNP